MLPICPGSNSCHLRIMRWISYIIPALDYQDDSPHSRYLYGFSWLQGISAAGGPQFALRSDQILSARAFGQP
ncbi:MAG: hypothetical protein V3S51_05095 [Dehalococcoidia bacterium]